MSQCRSRTASDVTANRKRRPQIKPNHIPVPRYKYATDAGTALLSMGFRPFFLLAGLWAATALGAAIAMMHGAIPTPAPYDPIAWHSHEMLFGFVAATLTGFLLTAIPNWTGRLPLQGMPLLGLVLLWIAGRAAMILSGWIGIMPAALIDLAFLGTVLAATLREIISGKNWKNLPIVAALGVLLAGNLTIHLEMMEVIVGDGLGERLSIAVIVLLITLVGGRVVPSFSLNWMKKQGHRRLPASFGLVDGLTLAATLAALGWWTVQPEGRVTGALAAVAAAANLVRLLRWRGWATVSNPLLWVLHLGYLWIPTGLALMALSQWSDVVPASGALHALTIGAIGTMTMGIMSRATLGHSGRPLQAGPVLALAYGLVSLAAAARILSSLVDTGAQALLWSAASSWILAFLLFVFACGPILVRPKPDSTP